MDFENHDALMMGYTKKPLCDSQKPSSEMTKTCISLKKLIIKPVRYRVKLFTVIFYKKIDKMPINN